MVRFPLLVILLAGFVACAGEPETPADNGPSAAANASPASPPPAGSAREASPAPRIVVLGDSLTAGLGLEPSQSFPSLLQERLTANGYDYEVVNAGVSGDTSAGGLRRLDWALEGDVEILVIELGANDGLRGLPVAQMKQNLATMIERAQARGITVILTGMEAPPNYGQQYTNEFREAYKDLARQYNVPFIPFLLDGVAGIPELNNSDGIHPNPQGARIIERTLWQTLEPVLDRPSR